MKVFATKIQAPRKILFSTLEERLTLANDKGLSFFISRSSRTIGGEAQRENAPLGDSAASKDTFVFGSAYPTGAPIETPDSFGGLAWARQVNVRLVADETAVH